MTLLQPILKAAVDNAASDIHLKPDQVPVFRIHGTLTNADDTPMTLAQVASIGEHILPEHVRNTFKSKHEVDFSHSEPGIGRFRVNYFMAQGKPCIVMRHVKTEVPDFKALRLPAKLKDFAALHRGIVLLCGTTGSGKSTTLAAIIDEINRRYRRRIVTIEDPIEYLFTDRQAVITQREVGIDTRSYQDALVHLMRQDPDVVLIGEMRDRSSIRVALLAAQTGHLVLSSLHATTSAMAIPRMLDMFPQADRDQVRNSLAQNLEAVVTQRMLRDMDNHYIPTAEIMINTSTVRKLIESNRLDVLSAAIETGGEDGMQSFNQSIYEMVKNGVVTEEQGLQFAGNAEALQMNLKGIFLDEASRILSDL